MRSGGSNRERLWQLEREAIAHAAQQRDEMRLALVRHWDGIATLEQYRLIFGGHLKKELKRWKPALWIGRASRELGLKMGLRPTDAEWDFLVGDVLSVPPERRLSADQRAMLTQADELLGEGRVVPDLRASAAWARLLIGPGDGLRHRANLWAGPIERSAAKEVCDSTSWRVAGLHASWDEVDAYLNAKAADHGLPPAVDGGGFSTTHAGVVAILRELHGGG